MSARVLGGDRHLHFDNRALCSHNDLHVSKFHFLTFYRTYGIAGWWGTVLLGLPYLASLLNVLRNLYLCAMTEPGIIPKVRSQEINYNKTYFVAYRSADEIQYNN